MAKRKLLNGLPNDLIHSFFSTLRYWEKGYMSDWIVNSGNDLKVKNIRIDILKKEITPKELEIKPIIYNISGLGNIITKVTKHAGFEFDFIKKAEFEIEIFSNRQLKCKAILIGKNEETFESKEYFEESFEKFKVFNRSMVEIGIEKLNKLYFKIKVITLGRRAFGKLKYTRRLENIMK